MTYQNRPKAPFAKTETEATAPEAVVAEAIVEAVAEAPAPALYAPQMGAPLAAILKGAVNDMHHYGVITDAEAVSLKERIEAKS